MNIWELRLTRHWDGNAKDMSSCMYLQALVMYVCIYRHWSFETYPPRPGASPNLAANVYEALFLPHLDYCSEVWGCI